MTDYKLGAVESRFADIIWSNEPMTTGELIKLCEKELNWKRTTTYTVLKKLSEHGIFQMKEKLVTSLISREEYYALRSEQFVAETFQGSLPAFSFFSAAVMVQKLVFYYFPIFRKHVGL